VATTIDRLYKVDFSTEDGDTITVDFEENEVTFTDSDDEQYVLRWTDLCDLMSLVERMLNDISFSST
jgi:hypothetical protein